MHRAPKNSLAWILLIVGLLTLPFAVIALWLRFTLLDTNQFVKTLSPLSTDPVIVASVSKNISDNFFQNINTEDKIREALPENNKFLAPVLSVSLKSFVENKGQDLITSKQFNQVWETIIRTIHPQIMNLLEGNNNLLKSQNGVISLDFKDIISPLRRELNSKGIKIFDNVAIDTKIILLKSDKLASIQTITNHILSLGAILPLLVLVFLIGSVLASANHRKFLVHVGFGISLSMLLLLFIIYLGQQQFISASGELSIEATSALYKIITHYLQVSAWIILILGIVIALSSNYLPKKFHIK